ncbi:NYN domain-containing protein [Candidatus Aerophobetes bacterium]|uniref:NYN domain-containing protein n=1 Tax=Aerophobetes bacterium TaxID=2030807 RepID=A0A523YN93_UNCAE|nr:MAG: NYN domain-containing protein [Candidatus Aerophobetes bacterium]
MPRKSMKRKTRTKGRVTIFVDGASMFYAQRDNKWHIDYKRVYQYFARGKELAGAYYFTGTPHFEDTERIRAYRMFKKALIYIGYTVIDKEVKVIIDRQTKEKIIKGNLDVEITLHMITSMDSYDEAVLLGGDSDFVPVIQHLRTDGKKVICVGRKQSTALELLNATNLFIDLNQIRDKIEKIRKGSS